MNPYRFLIDRGWWALLILFAVAGVLLGLKIPDLEFDANMDLLVTEEGSGGGGGGDVEYYKESRPVWGWDEYAMFCVTGEDWFSPGGVKLLREILDDLESIPHVTRTFSIFNLPLFQQGGRLDPKNLKSLSKADVDLEKARKELVEHEVASKNVISEDGRSLNILVYLDVPVMEDYVAELGRRRIAMINGLREKAKSWTKRLPERVRLSGIPILNRNIIEYLEFDVRVFSFVSLGFFLLAFLLIYRRLRFMVMPILTSAIPVVLILGGMVALGLRVTIITSNIPVLLFVLLLPYSVYFIERYRERRRAHPEEPGNESTVAAAKAVWWPCFFSCITTVAGFASLWWATRIRPVRTFGEMMTWGLLIGLLLVFLFLPSLSRPLPAMTVRESRKGGGLVGALGRVAVSKPLIPVILGVLFLVGGIFGALRLTAETKFTEYFWPSSELYQGLEYIDKRMGGSASLEIILESEKKNYFLSREGLRSLQAVVDFFNEVPETGKAHSFKSITDEAQKAGISAFAVMAMSRQPFFRAFAGTYATEDYQSARVFVRMQETSPTLNRNKIIADLNRHLDSKVTPEQFKNLKRRPVVTGMFLIYANTLNTLIQSQKDSLIVVAIVIFVMLLILFQNPILALLLLLPQALPAIVMLGVMGWFGVPLDLITVMLASIAMGVGVDSAIQYTYRYRQELRADGDRTEAIHRAHATTGRAILISTTVIVAGFCVLALSNFVPSVYFGVFTAVAMLMSQFADLLLLPALFVITGVPKK